MIVWINGAFGSGKTTLAEELHRRLPDALPFDPEYVGAILVKWAPPAPSSDFQDIPLWRKLVADFAIGLADDYGRTVIAPMTLVNAQYRNEIFGRINAAGQPLMHVFLDVPAPELRRRIDAQILIPDDAAADAEAGAFRHNNVDRCVAARAGLPPKHWRSAETTTHRANSRTWSWPAAHFASRPTPGDAGRRPAEWCRPASSSRSGHHHAQGQCPGPAQ